MCAETTHLIWASLSTTKGSHSGGSRARHFFQCKPQALLPTGQCSPSPYTAKGVLSKSHYTCSNCTSVTQRHSKTLDMPNRNQEIILRINQTRKQNFVEVDGALPAHRQQKNAPYPKKKSQDGSANYRHLSAFDVLNTYYQTVHRLFLLSVYHPKMPKSRKGSKTCSNFFPSC